MIETADLANLANNANPVLDCRRYADACHALYRAYHRLAGLVPNPDDQDWHNEVNAALPRAEKAADLPVGYYY